MGIDPRPSNILIHLFDSHHVNHQFWFFLNTYMCYDVQVYSEGYGISLRDCRVLALGKSFLRSLTLPKDGIGLGYYAIPVP